MSGTLPDSDAATQEASNPPTVPPVETEVKDEPFVIDMSVSAAPSFRPVSDGINTASPASAPAPPVTFNKDGTPRKKRGPKTGAAAMPSKNVPTDQMLMDSCAAVADIASGSLASIIGPEWHLEETERTQLSVVGAAYMKSKNMDDISPGAMLAVTIAAVAAKRLKNPNTMEKVQFYGYKLYMKIKGYFWKG